jgi:hypothetical protein
MSSSDPGYTYIVSLICGQVIEPHLLLRRLAMSVPPLRFHTVKYGGVLASAIPWRSRIGPRPDKKTTETNDTTEHAAKPTATPQRGCGAAGARRRQTPAGRRGEPNRSHGRGASAR